MDKRKRVLALGLLLVCTAACSSSPATRYYMLKPTSAPRALASGSGLAIGVGPAIIPKRLDQSRIVSVGAGNEVTLAETHEWAEPLDESIVEIIGENLANLLGTSRVYRHPWNSDVEMDHRVALTVIRLGGGLGTDAYLDVRWSILDGEGLERTRRTSSFRRPVASQTYAAMAAAISEMLGELSGEIAGAIQGRPAAMPPAMPATLPATPAAPPMVAPPVLPGPSAPPPPPLAPPDPLVPSEPGLAPLGELGPPEIRPKRISR